VKQREKEDDMIRWLLVGGLCVLLLAGCGDARRPAVRGAAPEPELASPAQSEGGNSFHGSPHGMGGMESPDMTGGMASPHGMPSPEALGPEVKLGPVTLTAPDSWVRSQPRSLIVLAEFSLPRAEGEPADGRLTVTEVGGSVEANVDRWREQFEGKPQQESVKEAEIAGVKVALVDLSGTYLDQHMGLGPAEPHSGYRMLGAIFTVGGQQFVIKGYGPEKTLAEHSEEFQAFIRSMKSAEPESTAPTG
jgi:hypothetical protein